MRTFSFSGSDTGPHLLITGGVHGDEYEPIAAILDLVALLRGDDPRAASLRGRVTLVPCVNEAAFLRGTRCAEDGLDLARTCPGDITGSVTERTADELSQLIRRSDLYIDLHTGGNDCSIYPLAGYMLVADRNILQQQRRMAHAFNLPVVWGTSAQLEGRSLSVARDAEIPAIYCEYQGGGPFNGDGQMAFRTGCLRVMAEFGLLDMPPVPNRVQYSVEDDRPDSGHLQICHPSPVTGIFRTDVRLGQHVHKGDVLGRVRPVDGSPALSIPADRDGLVIVLRTSPLARKGESVGVVMNTKR